MVRHFYRISIVICVATAASAIALAAAVVGPPRVTPNRGCYLLGQRVSLRGAGFAANRTYVVTIDGVYFGQSRTDSQGTFVASLKPGGLDAGYAQQVYDLQASDGSSLARASFTVTRRTGGLFLATRGNPRSLRAPFEVWDFAPSGGRRSVYVHYISPRGRSHSTVRLGQTGGQCGYLRTPSRRVFPFSPSIGTWTLQLDTSRSYLRKPGGPVAKIRVLIQ